MVCVSDAEARLLQSQGIAKRPFLGHAFYPRASDLATFGDRSGFLFVGSLQHPNSPNVDSLLWFLDAVWPRLRELVPQARFTIVGQIASEVSLRLTAPNVTVMGQVPIRQRCSTEPVSSWHPLGSPQACRTKSTPR